MWHPPTTQFLPQFAYTCFLFCFWHGVGRHYSKVTDGFLPCLLDTYVTRQLVEQHQEPESYVEHNPADCPAKRALVTSYTATDAGNKYLIIS